MVEQKQLLFLQTSSPSRTYVAIQLATRGCNQDKQKNKEGYKFVKFFLPSRFENTNISAYQYYLNNCGASVCIEDCFSLEDFQDVSWHK